MSEHAVMSACLSNPDFQEKGYVVVRNILGYNIANQLRESIEAKIRFCAQEIACTPQDYLSAVSRWLSPSPVTSAVTDTLLNEITQTIQAWIQKPTYLKKMNVICKNAYCAWPIAYHQDISYSPNDPYEFSTWIALDDISEKSSPLEVIPRSHLLPLKPAVDFWALDYEPNTALGCQALKVPVGAGDAVFFDSRLWHGSGESQSLSSRYALVLRWASEGWSLGQSIPPIQSGFFGLWTSGKMTEELLSEGLRILFQKSGLDFLSLVEMWQHFIREKSLSFLPHPNAASEALKKLKILHLAHTHHQGGDATGIVYRTLWQTFLYPLQCHINSLQGWAHERKFA